VRKERKKGTRRGRKESRKGGGRKWGVGQTERERGDIAAVNARKRPRASNGKGEGTNNLPSSSPPHLKTNEMPCFADHHQLLSATSTKPSYLQSYL
jgi:hypothetical protein